jgi:hypothetical protein
MRWNGTAWHVLKRPDNAVLSGVAATSRTNVWAVGSYTKGGVNRTLALHWNGKAWRP